MNMSNGSDISVIYHQVHLLTLEAFSGFKAIAVIPLYRCPTA